MLVLMNKRGLGQVQSSKQDYKNYHIATAKASKFIVQHKFGQAILVYDSIFKLYEPFVRDAYKAMQIACCVDSNRLVLRFFKIGVENGLNVKVFKTNLVCKKWNNRKNFQVQIDECYKLARASYLKK
jgi:hypothetical protein